MKIGDFITEGDKVGIITGTHPSFDWEVTFLTRSHTGCITDCCNNCHIKPYFWKPYPKTWKQIFVVILQKLFPKIDFYRKYKNSKTIAERI